MAAYTDDPLRRDGNTAPGQVCNRRNPRTLAAAAVAISFDHDCAFGDPDRANASAAAANIRGVSIEIDDNTRSMLWPQTEDRRLKDPERQLLDAITVGELDAHLVAIADAVHARRQLLRTVRSAQAIAELCVGDAVMFTNGIRPRYLEHELAVVTDVDDRTVSVRLSRPVGRFGERELRCPPLALRKLDLGTSIVDS